MAVSRNFAVAMLSVENGTAFFAAGDVLFPGSDNSPKAEFIGMIIEFVKFSLDARVGIQFRVATKNIDPWVNLTGGRVAV